MNRLFSFRNSKQEAGRESRLQGRTTLNLSLVAVAATLLPASLLFAQTTPTPAADKEKVINGYATHQSIELGGHIADYSGSGAMWDTLVNLQSGPRILEQSLTMRSVSPTSFQVFDNLFTNSYGYGGDPISGTNLRFSKGKAYEFDSSFRRYRQYFDYDLLANPLIPSNAVPYQPVKDSPHAFNTVRRLTDVNMTILPLSKISFRVGYSKNTSEGPSYSTYHGFTDFMEYQWWRNSSNTFRGGVDWKALDKTTVSYDQFYVYYKGDTTWNLTEVNAPLWKIAPLGYQVANPSGGYTAATLGIDVFTTASNTCLVSGTTNTIKNNCSQNFAYHRYSPTRTKFPTEQFRFSSANLSHVTMNGRVLYGGATGHVYNFNEYQTGLSSRTGQRQETDQNVSGQKFANTKQVNVAADFGITINVNDKISITDIFNFMSQRSPGSMVDFQNSLYGQTSTTTPITWNPATCPAPYTAATCPYHASGTGPDVLTQTAYYFLGVESKTNTVTVSYDPSPIAKFTAGYRYRTRQINDSGATFNAETYYPMKALRGDCAGGPLNSDGSCNASTNTTVGPDSVPIHEHWGLFGLFYQPLPQWRINMNVDAMYADDTFTRISPRQLQHYRIRTNYKVNQFVNVAATFNDFESRNNVQYDYHLDHARDFSFTTTVSPSEKWSIEANYAYDNIYSSTNICYPSTPPPSGSVANSPSCAASPGTGYLLGTGYYSEPTQFGSISIRLAPVSKLHGNFGYRVSAVDGHTQYINPLQVPGSLQSEYQTPFADLSYTMAPGWQWKAAYNYYSYGEGSPIGPTLPRSTRGNVYTLSVKYAF